jgi:capsular polysaccharide biosynthesis protein
MSDIEVGASLTNDYKKVVYTWEVLEQTMKNLGLKHSIDELRSMIAVHNPSNTRIMEISVESVSANEAAAIANELMAVVSEYIPRVIESVKPNILSGALVSTRPFSPNMLTNMAIGGFAGAALGIFAVFIYFLLDDRIKSAGDIRRYVGIPLLAAIPRPMERSRRDKA